MRVGVDLMSVGELERLRARRWFDGYAFAPAELSEAAGLSDARAREFLAGRFAAKEAVLKAFRMGLFQGVAPREIVVARASSGAPEVTLHGAARTAADAAGVRHLDVSITHKGDLVVAVAAGWS
ncbi:4'-phosphopantetheinyl transferase superfamily protein [Microbispora hainanensis]|jgi:holo-[acyl-carrier protein] synthase|uniref:Holo-[acyl-carrier-protein] synthase n=1 Tax=Microbispora hainanensis TaxID=568844 RepID=A0ABZ1SPQ3_9ACTN|nr:MULTISPECIES: 4'-phosphopantetheinyl transferase superfamily protein [Microbispora]NJP26126.1 4'-phosphopantetheinyl transferase superfamily protein [Microbispora sp. CL1-1]TQS12562.1 4'-phosphopantetheinyl transferase superfamily protein [Microbispora sp. SCL1-1]